VGLLRHCRSLLFRYAAESPLRFAWASPLPRCTKFAGLLPYFLIDVGLQSLRVLGLLVSDNATLRAPCGPYCWFPLKEGSSAFADAEPSRDLIRNPMCDQLECRRIAFPSAFLRYYSLVSSSRPSRLGDPSPSSCGPRSLAPLRTGLRSYFKYPSLKPLALSPLAFPFFHPSLLIPVSS